MRKLTDNELSLFLGKDFIHGTNDCFSLVREFYQVAFGIEITNYARPDYWWNAGLDLYSEFFPREGFKSVEIVRPSELKYGDVILMAIKSTVPCHAAIYIGEGKILHHFYGRKSSIELYKSIWYNTTTTVARHRDVVIEETYNRRNLLDDERIKHQLLLLRQRAGSGGNYNLEQIDAQIEQRIEESRNRV
jgi:cell wall-associated NlpC family hydrolase